ncbi:unnamed protein product [Leptidea sinapis]|uniref:Uncharacterized protein n=1 Tax=Leptidea sinapis TaxID=189913 RepID=A0A5E4PPH9_9NEOP|nr:unnamed protein product [Leptidea sinapis]
MRGPSAPSRWGGRPRASSSACSRPTSPSSDDDSSAAAAPATAHSSDGGEAAHGAGHNIYASEGTHKYLHEKPCIGVTHIPMYVVTKSLVMCPFIDEHKIDIFAYLLDSLVSAECDDGVMCCSAIDEVGRHATACVWPAQAARARYLPGTMPGRAVHHCLCIHYQNRLNKHHPL